MVYNVGMDTAAETLLIIVSAVLSIFLIILCVLAIYVIRVVRRINQMADRAEYVASSVEDAAEAVKNTAAAMPLVRLLAKAVGVTQKKARKDKYDGKKR